jgi:hypothetical protein
MNDSQKRPRIVRNDYTALRLPPAEGWQPSLSVSVVKPAYGAQGKLDLTLAALAAQTYPDDLMEVVVQAAGLLADYELLAHGLQVLSGQPLPTVSHASSSRRKSTDHPKPNPTPAQRQRLVV